MIFKTFNNTFKSYIAQCLYSLPTYISSCFRYVSLSFVRDSKRSRMKNDQLAAVFLSKAVSAATSKNFTAALEDYNNCLRFATSTSNLPIEVYMGRAFIYCELVQFENCFQNLRLAFNEEFGCHRRFFKLMELCARCHRMLGDADAFAKDSHGSIMNFFKLSLPSNPKIPFIADCLQVRKTEEFGRAIMTTKSLKTGDVVVIEEPFYKVLDASLKHLRCAICLRQSNLDLIACETCSNGESTYVYSSYQQTDFSVHYSNVLLDRMP